MEAAEQGGVGVGGGGGKWGEGELGNFSVNIEFQFCKMERFWKSVAQ